MRAALILLLFASPACSPSSELDDAAKRERIQALYAEYAESFPEVPRITAADLRATRGSPEEPIVVDVRTAEEQAVSRIPGAVTREQFERRRSELAGRTVVTYCTIGYRSGLYARELRADGWAALNLEGSLLEWTHVGGELEADGQPTRRVHVYGREWDLAASGYEAVW